MFYFDVPRSSQNLPVYTYMRLLKQYPCVYTCFDLKSMYIGRCEKWQIFLEFPLMWIWVTCLLAFHIPWDRLDLTFHYPIEALYKEPFGYIEEGGIKEQENYSPLFPKLILESASICPLENFVFFPRFPLLVSFLSRDGGLKWWRPRWRTQFLWFTDMLPEVVAIVIYVLY